jgi:hypothetical protein
MSDLMNEMNSIVKCKECGTEQSSDGEEDCTSCGARYRRYCLIHEIWDVEGHCPECWRIEEEHRIVVECKLIVQNSSREDVERYIKIIIAKHGSFPELDEVIKQFSQKYERIDFLKSFIFVLEKQNNISELAKLLEELVSLEPCNIAYREKLARAEIYLGRVH